MITADQSNTAATTPGQRYIIFIKNSSGGNAIPSMTWEGGGAEGLKNAEGSDTGFGVNAGESKWLTFYATGTGITLSTASSSVVWTLLPIN